MTRIVAVPPWAVRRIAKIHKKQIERACSRSDHDTPEGLISGAERREAVFWRVGDTGVCFTRCVLMNDGRKAVEVTAMAGALSGIFELRDRLREYRKAEHREFLLVIGREGWGRVFNQKPVGMSTAGQFIFEDYG